MGVMFMMSPSTTITASTKLEMNPLMVPEEEMEAETASAKCELQLVLTRRPVRFTELTITMVMSSMETSMIITTLRLQPTRSLLMNTYMDSRLQRPITIIG